MRLNKKPLTEDLEKLEVDGGITLRLVLEDQYL
jgi:hypothetical protein